MTMWVKAVVHCHKCEHVHNAMTLLALIGSSADGTCPWSFQWWNAQLRGLVP